MSIIEIDEKAVTEEQGQEMIARTLAMPDPLGIPTLFFNPDDFSPHWLESLPGFLTNMLYGAASNGRIEKEVRARIDEFETASGLSTDDASSLQPKAKEIAQIILNAKLNPKDLHTAAAWPQSEAAFPPHLLVPLAYQEPSRNAITISKVETAEQMHASFFAKKPSDISTRPGPDSAYRFFTIWHEVGHGTGATEPQTETIAAIATRKAFADTAVLKAQADVRAVRAILRGKNVEDRDADSNRFGFEADEEDKRPEVLQYGWPMVEANDYVAGLREETIDALDEQQIKQIRHQLFDHLGELVSHLSTLLEKQDPEAFRDADFAALDYTAAKYRKEAEQGGAGKDFMQILTRFQLAARRLHVGAPAYQEGTNHVDQDLLASERAQPLTFTPGEFIPEDAPEV